MTSTSPSTSTVPSQSPAKDSPSLLDQPVLTLAIDNLAKLNNIDEKQLSAIWNLFTKCKDNLENGRRLENISWRLWYRSCHPSPLSVGDEEDDEYLEDTETDLPDLVPSSPPPSSSSHPQASEEGNRPLSSTSTASLTASSSFSSSSPSPLPSNSESKKKESIPPRKLRRNGPRGTIATHKAQTVVSPASFTRVLDVDYKKTPWVHPRLQRQLQQQQQQEQHESTQVPSSSEEEPCASTVDEPIATLPQMSIPITNAVALTNGKTISTPSASDPDNTTQHTSLSSQEPTLKQSSPGFDATKSTSSSPQTTAMEVETSRIFSSPPVKAARPTFFISSSQTSLASLTGTSTPSIALETPVNLPQTVLPFSVSRNDEHTGLSSSDARALPVAVIDGVDTDEEVIEAMAGGFQTARILADSLDGQRRSGVVPRQTQLQETGEERERPTGPVVATVAGSWHDSETAEEDSYDDDESFYSEDYLSDELSDGETESCYGESWSYSPSPLFKKISVTRIPSMVTQIPVGRHHQATLVPPSALFPTKKRSLLSAALTMATDLGSSTSIGLVARRCSQHSNAPLSRAGSVGGVCMSRDGVPVVETGPAISHPGSQKAQTLTNSLRQTLLWDRSMPFNTTVDPSRRAAHAPAPGPPQLVAHGYTGAGIRPTRSPSSNRWDDGNDEIW